MKATQLLPPKVSDWIRKYPESILMIGAILMVVSHLRFSASIVAWVCMVPFLYYLQLPSIKYKFIKFVLALVFSWSLIVFKIITDPIPVLLVFMYSIPIALIHLPGYFFWYKGGRTVWGKFMFPIVMVIMEWLQYTYTPLGSWGSISYTQAGQEAILQSLSLFGMAGLGVLIYSFNTMTAAWLLKYRTVYKAYRWVVPTVVLLVLFGEMRIDYYTASNQQMIKLAAIGTDSEAGGLPLPSTEKNTGDFRRILQRTKVAAMAGSQLAVWTEAAFFTEPVYEKNWVDSMKEVADEYNISIVASYVNVISLQPFKYENKYHWINPDGEIERTYFKHEPVPGEPAVKGTEAFAASELNGVNIAGAICYDYDFPYVARGLAQVGADIVALPSSDWQGIDPLHTDMAAFRAIEQGHSILRSTRFGLSSAIDPTGATIAQLSSFDEHNGVLIADVPKAGLKTVYSVVNDLLVYLGIAFLLVVGVVKIVARKKE